MGWRKRARILTVRDIKAVMGELSTHLTAIVNAKMELPWLPGRDMWHAVSKHITKRDDKTGEKLGDVWVVCTVFVTNDEEEFRRVFEETRLFLRSKGESFEEFTKKLD
jgi:hypothetical protein